MIRVILRQPISTEERLHEALRDCVILPVGYGSDWLCHTCMQICAIIVTDSLPEQSVKTCLPNGTWYREKEMNNEWTDYSSCVSLEVSLTGTSFLEQKSSNFLLSS